MYDPYGKFRQEPGHVDTALTAILLFLGVTWPYWMIVIVALLIGLTT